MDRERVLITGAGGFLGSHIAHHFGSQGHLVAAVGRFSAPPASARIYPHLSKLCGMTLPDPAFHGVLAEFQPTLLVHCAGTSSVADSVREPYADFTRTVEVLAFTLEATRLLAPRCRFVLLSSASVYGNPETLPVAESAPLKPVSPYGYHKMLSETLAEEYAVLHGLKVAVLRIFSAYGERLGRQVIHDVCLKVADPRLPAVELFGSGEESRDFIHATDVARVIETIHARDAVGIFNTAAGVQTTIAELVGAIRRHFKSDKRIVFNGVIRPGDPLNWQASTERITALGFRRSIELDAGLASYVSWFKRDSMRKIAMRRSMTKSLPPAEAALAAKEPGNRA